MNGPQHHTPQTQRRSRLWMVQLLLAVLFAFGIHWLWHHIANWIGWNPPFDATELLAILAIAFAVVQFLDARGQEHELNTISGKLQTETANLGTQINSIFNQANQ